MSEINYQALREAAERAIPAMERLLMLPADDDLLSEQELKDYGVDIDALNAFKFLTGPETVLALLDERERNQQYIKRRDQENEDIALTVGRLRVELEGKDSKIANLTAERDALREGEMGDARHSNTRAAADIYFQLVEECEIPAGGSLVEYVDDMREKLEAAEKRIAELEAREIKPAKGEVLVVVSGFTGCGKSAIAGEIEIAMKAIGVPVQWTNSDAEKHMTGADWLTAIEMYKPTVRIVEVNVPRAAGIRIKGE
ncbi:ead/Ea22-like family protein [Escherichia coli]|nr:ead/Ea22-like family protein [Escherichia coli]